MRPNVLIQRLPSLVALVAIASATGCADNRKGPATGSLDGKCYPNGTCNPGLSCAADANVCVAALREGYLGGSCFADGHCNPGLICNGTVCEADLTIPPGTIGGACFANGTCNSSDLICIDSLCQVNEHRTGTVDGRCYDNGTCNPGLACNSGVCAEDATIPTGTLGGACLMNGTCQAGLLCVATLCEVDDRLVVGTAGAACFPNGTCNDGLECIVTVASGDSNAECAVKVYGILDGPCYANDTCNGGLVCQRGTCVDPRWTMVQADGADGGLCYDNGTCDGGLVCNSFGLCQPIVAGGLHGECGAGCNLGLSCYGGTCEPTIEHLASIHGVVTDYITNARLEGVVVTMIHQGAAQTSTTDALGYYQFDDLMPGHFELTFESTDSNHTMRRMVDVLAECNLFTGDPYSDGYYGDVGYQDQECNQVHDISLFPFTGTLTGKLWYLNDQEVTAAAGVRVVADYTCLFGTSCSGFDAGDNNGTARAVDISPDRFEAITDANGVFTFDTLPNTGAIGVRITVMPSSFNGFDYESWGPVLKTLDVFVQDNVEVFLTPQFDPPFIVANNWEDYLYGGFDVSQPIEMTFSRSMKTAGCDIHLAYAQEFKIGDMNHVDTRVPGVLAWSNDNMTATFTPASTLSTSFKYAVHVHNCESAIDDQEYNWISGNDGGVDGGGDLCCNVDGNACFSSEWNRQDFITQEGITCSLAVACFGPDDNFEITCNMPPNLDESTFELFRVVRYPGHHEENPDAVDSEVLVPVTFTPSVDGNTVIVDPTDSLVPSGEYRFSWAVASFIDNDVVGKDFTLVRDGFCAETETLEFVLANLPVVSAVVLKDTTISWLETSNGAQDIVMTFTKAVNIALSKVTIENDDAAQNGGNHGDDGIPVDYDQFGFILDATVTADGAVITVNPAADLPVGRYTVRYVVAAADGLGVAVGHLTFDVVPAPACIAFTGDNLGDRANANYNDNIELDFSTAVDPSDERNIIKLVDEFGGEWWPSFSVTNYTNDESVEITNGRVVVANPGGKLSPDRDYTITFKIYAAASRNHVWQGADESQEMYSNGTGGFCGGTEHGIYTQPAPITFTTEGHITLVSTTVGTYTDSNNDGYYEVPDLATCDISSQKIDCGDFQGSTTFAPNGVISLTFSETPDLAVYHDRNFVRLYRYTGGDNTVAANYDLVATTNTLTGKTVTLALLPLQTLQQPGGVYCIGYQVTSNLVFGGNQDVSENVGNTSTTLSDNADDPAPGAGIVPQLCFSTASPVVGPPTAPTAAPLLFLVNLVNSTDTTVWLRHSVLTSAATQGNVGEGTRWYEYYVSADDGDINDYVLWQTVEDCQETSTNNTDCTAATENLQPGPTGTRLGLGVLGDDVEATVCNGPDAPAFCTDTTPFDQGQKVFFRVRACTGSVGSDVTPLCGPFSLALEVRDTLPPIIEGLIFNSIDYTSPSANNVEEGAYNVGCDAPLTFNVWVFTSDPDGNATAPRPAFDAGTVVAINTLTRGSTTSAMTGTTCARVVQANATGTGGETAYSQTDEFVDWATASDWPDWKTDSNGFNDGPVSNWAGSDTGSWQSFPKGSLVAFECTVIADHDPFGTQNSSGKINLTATDASGNSTPLVVDVGEGNGGCAQ